MNKVEYALNQFNQDYNCAQSVFSTFAEEFGVSTHAALSIALPFGGGLARLGHVCGAVSGPLMCIGLMTARTNLPNKELKDITYQRTREFARRFVQRNGSLLCRELIGMDISTPEGLQHAIEKNTFSTTCVKFVWDAVEILSEILEALELQEKDPRNGN